MVVFEGHLHTCKYCDRTVSLEHLEKCYIRDETENIFIVCNKHSAQATHIADISEYLKGGNSNNQYNLTITPI